MTKPLKGFDLDHLIGEYFAFQIEDVVIHYGLKNIVEMKINAGNYKKLKAWYDTQLIEGKPTWFAKVNIEKGINDLKIEWIDRSKEITHLDMDGKVHKKNGMRTHSTILLMDGYVQAENHRNKILEQFNDPYKQNTNFMQLIQDL